VLLGLGDEARDCAGDGGESFGSNMLSERTESGEDGIMSVDAIFGGFCVKGTVRWDEEMLQLRHDDEFLCEIRVCS
jgi:hypothetical protein